MDRTDQGETASFEEEKMKKEVDKKDKKPQYVKPDMKTVVTPKEIRDIDQPCGFNKNK